MNKGIDVKGHPVYLGTLTELTILVLIIQPGDNDAPDEDSIILHTSPRQSGGGAGAGAQHDEHNEEDENSNDEMM